MGKGLGWSLEWVWGRRGLEGLYWGGGKGLSLRWFRRGFSNTVFISACI